MIGYSAFVVFVPSDLKILERATAVVRLFPDRDHQDRYIRCHEVARAVYEILDLKSLDGPKVEDGKYGSVEHSWIRFDRKTVLDVYAIGRLPMVQLVELNWQGRTNELFVPGPLREDIREDVLREMIDEARKRL